MRLLILLFVLACVAAQDCNNSTRRCRDDLCCSKYGYCDSTAAHCEVSQGCVDNCWGDCPKTACPSGQCCSQWGYCGTTADYCDIPKYGCKANCWGGCQKNGCPSGQCCGQNGACGTGAAYCSPAQNCISNCWAFDNGPSMTTPYNTTPAYLAQPGNGWNNTAEPSLDREACGNVTKRFWASLYEDEFLKKFVAYVPLTAQLAGQNCLMAGTFNGGRLKRYFFVVEANAINKAGVIDNNCYGCPGDDVPSGAKNCSGVASKCTYLSSATSVNGTFTIQIVTSGNYPISVIEAPPTQDETDVWFQGCQDPNNPCASGQCCSKWGYCGTTSDYCAAANCNSGACEAPSTEPAYTYADSASDVKRGQGYRALTCPNGFKGTGSNWGVLGDISWGSNQYTVTNGAIKMKYPAGSYSQGSKGGIGFYARPHDDIMNAKTVVFSYEIAFGKNFAWNKGGKLPGIYGGKAGGGKGCSGGDSGYGCFSMRYMWRRDGEGEAYIYTDKSIAQNGDLCKVGPKSECNPDYGSSIGRGSFRFQSSGTNGEYYQTITVAVTLNTFNGATPLRNGVLKVYYNGRPVIEYNKMIWRKTSDVKFSGIDYETFFGGSDKSWATPYDQYIWIRNAKLWWTY